MIVQNKTIVSHATLTCMASLVAAIMARLTNNGVTNMVNGNAVTRTAVAAGALADANKHLRGM